MNPHAAPVDESAEREATEPSRGTLSGAAAMLTAGSIFTQVASIVALGLLARLVSRAEIGTYQQLSLLYGIISPLLLAGIPAGLLYFLPRAASPARRAEWVGDTFALLTLFGILAMVLVLALRDPIAAGLGNPRLGPDLALYSPYLLFAFIAFSTPSALVAGGRPAAGALVNAIGGALMLVGVITAALISPDARALAIGLSASAAAWAAISLLIVHRSVGIVLRRRPAWAHWRALLAYGLPLALTGLAGRFGYQFDRLVVGARFSPSDFAIYALGTLEVPIALLLQQAVTNVMVPALSALWRDGNIAGMLVLWRESMRKTSLLLLPMFAFLLVTAPDVVRVLYGPGYGRSVELFRIYLALLPIRIATFGLIPQAIGRTRIVFVAGLLILGLNAVIVLALVGPLGLTGPALALPIASALTVAYYLVRVAPLLDVRPRDLVPVRRLAGISAAATGAALVILPIGALSLTALPRLLLQGVAFTAVCAAVLRVTRELSDDDLTRLRGALDRLRRSFRSRPAAPVEP